MVNPHRKPCVITFAGLLATVLLNLLPSSADCQDLRFALIAGSNRGLERQSALRYAERDADHFARLLADLGGFAPERVTVLKGAKAADFKAAFSKVEEDMRRLGDAGGEKALLVVFYSGHADGKNLEMGSDLLSFSELKDMVSASSAHLKIAIIDSCQSGAITATKGGRPGPGYDLALTDTADTDGTIIITSSSAGEKSQESADIRGSFFTHHLISGLMGAADQNQDNRVSLAEVYQYAYNYTVIDTSRTTRGAQHPSYEYRISGRGNVVLTDISSRRSALEFGPETAGTFLVVDAGTRGIAAEIAKPAGASRRLALPGGSYIVIHQSGEKVLSQRILLAEGAEAAVRTVLMNRDDAVLTLVKGGREKRSGWGVFGHYGLSSGALNSYGAVHQGSLGLRLDLGPTSLFPRVSYSQSHVDEKGLAYELRFYSFESYLAWRFEYSILDLFAGLNIGANYGTQRLMNDESRAGGAFTYGGVGGLDFPVYKGVSVQTFWEIGANAFRMNEEFEQNLVFKGVVGACYEF
ncbi:MAG: caspase family protein [Deltaproteobacteria bacterium]|nr:caspase family protein [Deltaproteobacteria bacterium]